MSEHDTTATLDAAATLATVTSAFAVGVWRSCWAIPTRGGLNRLCLMQP